MTLSLTGTQTPSGGVGEEGDYYINTDTSEIYGPKLNNSWGAPKIFSEKVPTSISLIVGNESPGSNVGVNGYYYLDITTLNVYGPKTDDTWDLFVNKWEPPFGLLPQNLTAQIRSPDDIIFLNKPPTDKDGTTGQFCFDMITKILYGPKNTTWSSVKYSRLAIVAGPNPEYISNILSPKYGINGDFFHDYIRKKLVGPKFNNLWRFSNSYRAPNAVTKNTKIIIGIETPPPNSEGLDGYYYFNQSTGKFYGPKSLGSWPPELILPRTALTGPSPPGPATGKIGDYFINTTTKEIFGPKGGGGWPSKSIFKISFNTTDSTGLVFVENRQPLPSDGIDGEFFVNISLGKIFIKEEGEWIPYTDPIKPATISGRNPLESDGDIGEYWINKSNNQIYGPKSINGWKVLALLFNNMGSSILIAPKNATRNDGSSGDIFINSNSLRYQVKSNNRWTRENSNLSLSILAIVSSINPTSDDGKNGDYWFNTNTKVFYGPKTSGSWEISTVLNLNSLSGRIIVNNREPLNIEGYSGDYFFNTSNESLVGPKTDDVWPKEGTKYVSSIKQININDPIRVTDYILTPDDETFKNDGGLKYVSIDDDNPNDEITKIVYGYGKNIIIKYEIVDDIISELNRISIPFDYVMFNRGGISMSKNLEDGRNISIKILNHELEITSEFTVNLNLTKSDNFFQYYKIAARNDNRKIILVVSIVRERSYFLYIYKCEYINGYWQQNSREFGGSLVYRILFYDIYRLKEARIKSGDFTYYSGDPSNRNNIDNYVPIQLSGDFLCFKYYRSEDFFTYLINYEEGTIMMGYFIEDVNVQVIKDYPFENLVITGVNTIPSFTVEKIYASALDIIYKKVTNILNGVKITLFYKIYNDDYYSTTNFVYLICSYNSLENKWSTYRWNTNRLNKHVQNGYFYRVYSQNLIIFRDINYVFFFKWRDGHYIEFDEIGNRNKVLAITLKNTPPIPEDYVFFKTSVYPGEEVSFTPTGIPLGLTSKPVAREGFVFSPAEGTGSTTYKIKCSISGIVQCRFEYYNNGVLEEQRNVILNIKYVKMIGDYSPEMGTFSKTGGSQKSPSPLFDKTKLDIPSLQKGSFVPRLISPPNGVSISSNYYIVNPSTMEPGIYCVDYAIDYSYNGVTVSDVYRSSFKFIIYSDSSVIIPRQIYSKTDISKTSIDKIFFPPIYSECYGKRPFTIEIIDNDGVGDVSFDSFFGSYFFYLKSNLENTTKIIKYRLIDSTGQRSNVGEIYFSMYYYLIPDYYIESSFSPTFTKFLISYDDDERLINIESESKLLKVALVKSASTAMVNNLKDTLGKTTTPSVSVQAPNGVSIKVGTV